MGLTRRGFMAATAGLLLQNSAQAGDRLQYILTDATGKVLDGKDADRRSHPASLTKIMTLYCVMKAMKDPGTKFNLDTPVAIPQAITRIKKGIAVFEWTKSHIGEKFPAQTLMAGAGSRSDAYSTLALALHLGDEKVYNWGNDEDVRLRKFINLMNKTAKDLGMDDTHFSVCTGLPSDNHYSTPRDIGKLIRAIHQEFPKSTEIALGQPDDLHLKPLSSATEHTSKILRAFRDEVMFAKTGWVNAGGFCLGLMADIHDHKVTAVIFGADSDTHRNEVMRGLLAKARETYPFIPVPSPAPRV